jgi:hypothetical protein
MRTCHATAHAAVKAVRDLQAKHGFKGPDIEAITVTGTARMIERHNILEPADLMLAQYSIPFFGSVVAKSAGDQQPDDVLSERLHWQIPDAEILYRGAIPFLRSEIPRRSCSVHSNDRPGLVVGCVSRRQ